MFTKTDYTMAIILSGLFMIFVGMIALLMITRKPTIAIAMRGQYRVEHHIPQTYIAGQSAQVRP